MKRLFIYLLLCLHLLSLASAKADKQPVERAQLTHTADSVQLTMRLLLPQNVGRNDVVLFIPRLINGNDSIDLPSVGVYGRMPYYYYVRSEQSLFQDQARDIMLRGKELDDWGVTSLSYARSHAMLPWFDGAEVKLTTLHFTCCGDLTDARDWRIVEHQAFWVPTTVTRQLTDHFEKKGEMHVDFVLDSIKIRPDYHENWRELRRLDEDLDTVLLDPRFKVNSVTIHGYASPEGPYHHNVWLAKNRTQALKRYIYEHHPIDSSLVITRYTPEDWAGLRRYVENSTLPHRLEILQVIDDTISRPDPDKRLAYIKRKYREDYRTIYRESLPYLRHSDYTISYSWATSRTIEEEGPKLPGTGRRERLLPDEPFLTLPTERPLFAVKTNLLFDALLWPNVEVEVPFGKDDEWSLMAEWGSPWYVWHHNSRAYEILNVGLELRRWLGRCPGCRPVLTGTFVGAYVAGGKYDLEWNSIGDQGEYLSLGGSYGKSWLLGKSWNLEVSGSVGVIFGQRRHYHGEFNDKHLIWKRFGGVLYAGPTQLKVSLVWLLPQRWFVKRDSKKGGRE